jgi:phage tail-like protein
MRFQTISDRLLIAAIAIFLAPAILRAQRKPDIPRNESSAWITGSSFTVETNGRILGIFHSLSGMASGLQDQEWNGPVRRRFGSVQLSGGDVESIRLFEKWRRQAADGKIGAAHRRVIITVNGADDKTIARYQLSNAWPIEVTGSGHLNEDAAAHLATVVLGCDNIQTIP